MKKLGHIYFIFLFCALISFASCDSDNGLKGYRLYNENDSIIFCNLVTQSGMTQRYGQLGVDLSDIKTWKDFTRWSFMKEYNQYRMTGIVANGVASNELPEMEVPSELSGLTELTELNIHGDLWSGELPEELTELTKIKRLYIGWTNITKLPENIFTENMNDVVIQVNKKLTRLPSSVKKLRDPEPWSPGLRDWFVFHFDRNAFMGECPFVPNARIRIMENNFTSFDWDAFINERPDNPEHYLYTGVSARFNYIKGRVPDELLKDTVKLVIASIMLETQNKSAGIENFPSEDERDKMIKEYCKNHPESNFDFITDYWFYLRKN